MKKEVKGKTAFKSSKIIRGKAKIVSNKKDIEKVQKGNIVLFLTIHSDYRQIFIFYLIGYNLLLDCINDDKHHRQKYRQQKNHIIVFWFFIDFSINLFESF